MLGVARPPRRTPAATGMWYQLIPNMPDDRLRALMGKFGTLLRQQPTGIAGHQHPFVAGGDGRDLGIGVAGGFPCLAQSGALPGLPGCGVAIEGQDYRAVGILKDRLRRRLRPGDRLVFVVSYIT